MNTDEMLVEHQRLAALTDLRILDSRPQAIFDALVAEASEACGVPISLITLVDAERQWFKAKVGIEATETPRNQAFCTFAIESDDPLVVPDALDDVRFCDNPLVRGAPHIRAYAGAPLITTTGHRLGTLCAIDLHPRIWTPRQLRTLTRLADVAVNLMEMQAAAGRTYDYAAQTQAKSLGELRYRTVVASMREGLVLHNRSGEIIEANPSASRILGLSEDQLLGRASVDPRWGTIHPDGTDFPGATHPAMVALQSGQSVDDVVMGVDLPSGERRWLSVSAQPLFRDDELTPYQSIATFNDITDARAADVALRESTARLEMALRISNSATWEINYNTGEYYSTGIVAKIFGRDISKDVLENIPQFIHPDDRDRVLTKWAEQVSKGEPLDVEHRVIRDGVGEPLWIHAFTIAHLNDQGQVERLVGQFRDISVRKAQEEQLREALQAAQSASAAKTRFLANTSHEIRTPLNGVIGVASALAQTSLADRQREMVDLILSSGLSLERVLNDILDLSKVEAGHLTIELRPFDLRTELASAAHLVGIRADDKGVEFALSFDDKADGVFLGDAVRLKQIVSNLASNAVKFTDAGSVRIAVSVEEAAGAEGTVGLTVTVSDTGIGFDPSAIGALFDRFSQADDTITRRFGGTGLGLSICKSLCELMGGDIVAQSAPGEGSMFQVRIPLLRSPGGLEGAAAHSEPSLGNERPLRVLLVEDHPVNQRVVELLLEPFAVELVVTANGAEAIQQFQTSSYDLILMDMQMPVLDGLEATREIRRLEALEGRMRTPIAMMTANTSELHQIQSREAGADGFIAKPVKLEALVETIDDLTRLAKG